MTEKKGINLDDAIQPPQEEELDPTPVMNTSEDLLEELQKHDPVLAMLTAKIFDIATVVTDLQEQVGIIKERQNLVERHLGHLISKDPEFKAHFARKAKKKDDKENK